MIFSEDDREESLLKLVATTPEYNFGAEIQELSINSPLGKVIYKNKVGNICSYSVNNRKFNVMIKQKLDLSKENTDPVKKLIK